MTRIGIFFVAVVVICAGLAAADTNYSKTVELPPLRASFEDLQSMLDKVSSIVSKGSSNWEEGLELRKGEKRVKMSGHHLEVGDAKIPSCIDSFEYNGRVSYPGHNREEAPITQVAITFHDYDRSISVEGRSPEQVELLVSALRDDLSQLSSPFGNFGRIFSTWAGRFFFGSILLYWALFAIWLIWKRTHRRTLVVPALVFCVVLFFVLLTLPDELFAGFSGVQGEASPLVRYGPQIAFLSLVIGLLSLVIPFVISLRPPS
jgi:hypothetical protein